MKFKKFLLVGLMILILFLLLRKKCYSTVIENNELDDTLKIDNENICNIDSKSQVGQDIWVTSKLKCKKNGYYLDIGASDGQHISNTLILDKKFNYIGLCIDPFPKNMKNRTCKVIKKAIYNKDDEFVDFIAPGSMLGGISEMITSKSKHYDSVKDKKIVKVETITPTTLFEQNQVPNIIDYLSLDIEGGELEVLKNIPFDKYCIRNISVEHNFEEPRRTDIKNLLVSKGYKYEGELKHDDLYSKNC